MAITPKILAIAKGYTNHVGKLRASKKPVTISYFVRYMEAEYRKIRHMIAVAIQ